MHKIIIRGAVAVAAAAALSSLEVAGAGVPGADARAGHPARAPSAGAVHAAAVPGTQLWVKRYNGPANGDDSGRSVAVSPTGATVFVTGFSTGTTSGADYATAAYNAVTGAKLWVNRYNGPVNGDDIADAVAVGRGGRVFVTGRSVRDLASGDHDYATVAYSASTGAQLWVRRYHGPGNGDAIARAVAVSPTGGTVFVTGGSAGDYATVAYNAVTGAKLWVNRYNGPANGDDAASAVAVSPGGGRVFVTGRSEGSGYATVAYNASTGAQLWVKLYNGGGASSLAVSPGGGTVFVTGGQADYATVAYNAATGVQLWARRYNGPAGAGDFAASVAVSPAGGTVFVTGDSEGGFDLLPDYATVAYNASTGAQLWVKRYNGRARGADLAYSVAVSPTGEKVFVTGWSNGMSTTDYATVAYSASTGAQLWVRRYHSSGNSGSFAYAVAVSPSANTVFVTGESSGATSGLDYATIAYSG